MLGEVLLKTVFPLFNVAPVAKESKKPTYLKKKSWFSGQRYIDSCPLRPSESPLRDKADW